MKLITGVEISGFRSLRNEKISSFGEMTAFVGKNSSGKSNILRSLNLFFNEEVEPGKTLDWDRDFNQYAARVSRRRRRIEIAVSFSIPSNFRFRKGLAATKELLERADSIHITRVWEPNTEDRFLLNGSEVSTADTEKIHQFLQLIRFRYIPNRVLPLSIIEDEQDSLAQRLVKRLALRREGNTAAFQQLAQQAKELSSRLAQVFEEASPDTKAVQLQTPTSWEDVLFQLGYSFISKHNDKISLPGDLEGSGNQSLLMLETLRLIDTDYSMSFGWRQSTIWAYEEPESSLHYSLEALISSKLRSYSVSPSERLQIIISTHSNLFAENSDVTHHVQKDTGETTINIIGEEEMQSGYFSKHGITRYSHPLLFYPRKTIIITEGKNDYLCFSKLAGFLSFSNRIEFTYIERLSSDPGATGGDEQIHSYIRSHKNLIESRFEDSPVVVLLDWDSKKVYEKMLSLAKNIPQLKILIWPTSDLNPELSEDFKGMERALPTWIIRKAAEQSDVTLYNRSGSELISYDPRDKEKLKAEIWKIAFSTKDTSSFRTIQDTLDRLVGQIVAPPKQPRFV